MNYQKIFSERLRKERMSQKKSQEYMAIVIDIARPSYIQYETEKNFPKVEKLILIANELNISIDYLLGLSNDNRPLKKE